MNSQQLGLQTQGRHKGKPVKIPAWMGESSWRPIPSEHPTDTQICNTVLAKQVQENIEETICHGEVGFKGSRNAKMLQYTQFNKDNTEQTKTKRQELHDSLSRCGKDFCHWNSPCLFLVVVPWILGFVWHSNDVYTFISCDYTIIWVFKYITTTFEFLKGIYFLQISTSSLCFGLNLLSAGIACMGHHA